MTLDPETLALFDKLQRQHMRPDILKMAGWQIETNHGTEYLPDDVVGPDADAESVADFVEGDKVYSLERITGKWFARLSAPIASLQCARPCVPIVSSMRAGFLSQ